MQWHFVAFSTFIKVYTIGGVPIVFAIAHCLSSKEKKRCKVCPATWMNEESYKGKKNMKNQFEKLPTILK